MHKENDKSKAICSKCRKVVSTTFLIRDVEIGIYHSSVKVPDLLVAVCDECDAVAAIPQVSFQKIKLYREQQ